MTAVPLPEMPADGSKMSGNGAEPGMLHHESASKLLTTSD
eukprot:CAMPEP_0197906280 /NCGR_PEP_ID=MMETSP1439-20131203/62246_1 /TAXON_ID=66791 /ORGANISM="Gonyaulax spinifera, Strain CCMP409" /LENGTH=39 /DNA_ID= /DNA_START= /DNA_END= /DNA_ORIENTATION=